MSNSTDSRSDAAPSDLQPTPTAFPPCPSFCEDDHRESLEIDEEIGLRMHERVVAEVEATDAVVLTKPAKARVMVERCDVAGAPAAPTRILLSIDHPDAPDLADVDVTEVTRGISDASCRAIAAACLSGAEKTGMAMNLPPAAALQLGQSLLALGIDISAATRADSPDGT